MKQFKFKPEDFIEFDAADSEGIAEHAQELLEEHLKTLPRAFSLREKGEWVEERVMLPAEQSEASHTALLFDVREIECEKPKCPICSNCKKESPKGNICEECLLIS